MLKVVDWVQDNDKVIFLKINRFGKYQITNFITSVVTNLGGSVFSTAVSVLLLLSGDYRLYGLGQRLGPSLLVSHLIVRIGKGLFPRLRPYLMIENVYTGRKLYKDTSFPSGHSTAAFCMAAVFSSFLPVFSLTFFLLAGLVAISRVYLGMHYPSDIIAGAGIGILTALLMI